MSIDATSNVFDSMRTKVSPKTSVQPFTAQPHLKPIPEDTYSFSEGMGENLKFSKEKSLSGPVFDGTLNGKKSSFKIIGNNKATYYEGLIDDKKLLLKCEKNLYTGSYGDEKVILYADFNEPSKLSDFYNCKLRGKTFKPDYFNIKGNIGEKEININLPNAQIPQDEAEKDMVSLLLFDNGLEARTFDGEIVGLGYSTAAKGDIQKSLKRRNDTYKEDIKPLISQGSGLVIGSVVTALMAKLIHRKP